MISCKVRQENNILLNKSVPKKSYNLLELTYFLNLFPRVSEVFLRDHLIHRSRQCLSSYQGWNSYREILPWENRYGCWSKTPPCPGRDRWGVWCSDTAHGVSSLVKREKRDQTQESIKTSEMVSLMSPSPMTEMQHPQLPLRNSCSPSPVPSRLQGDIMKAQQSSAILGGKSQKRVGWRRRQSWDTTAASMKLDGSQMLPRHSYAGPLQNCG